MANDNPTVRYQLLNKDELMYMVQYIFLKLKGSPLNVNSTYTISRDDVNERIVLTDDQGATSYISYSDFGEENVLEGVQIDGTDLSITNKKVNIPVAGASVKGVITTTTVNTMIQTALSNFERISFEKVASYSDLPVTGENGVIYLVPNSGTVPNIYDEYIWYTDSSTTPATQGYEKIGTTAIDLSGYVQHTDIYLLTNAEVTDIVDDAYDAVFNPTTP
ncbi:MAG: hypothetical protein J6T10_29340 [Methanobrevibacter sp.]|nr:hypothetical protein [Methanobrevibacter sp.]